MLGVKRHLKRLNTCAPCFRGTVIAAAAELDGSEASADQNLKQASPRWPHPTRAKLSVQGEKGKSWWKSAKQATSTSMGRIEGVMQVMQTSDWVTQHNMFFFVGTQQGLDECLLLHTQLSHARRNKLLAITFNCFWSSPVVHCNFTFERPLVLGRFPGG